VQVRNPKDIIRNLFTKYAKVEGNVIYAEKLFTINAIIKYIYRDSENNNISKEELKLYGEAIDRYLKNEVDIKWKHGKIIIKDIRPRGE
jgi:hypothetical protein